MMMRAGLLSFALAAVLLPGRTHAQTPSPDPVVLAAGDIASCSSNGDEETADLLDTLDGTVLALGDLAYSSGTASEFANCYDPTWGRHKARTMPSPGNHEYNTPGAAGYYGYFGAAAGDPAKGYYSFDLGTWHIVALNSNSSCAAVPCGAGSVQEQWLRQDLAAHPTSCTLAYWHHPRFSSGANHGNNSGMQALWQALYDHGADIILNGHEHIYERFAKQSPAQQSDPTYGIRQFVVGTGGRSHYGLAATPQPHSEVRNGDTYGVLQLTLQPTGYDWEFIPVAGETFSDSGSDVCSGGTSGVGGETRLTGSDAAGRPAGGSAATVVALVVLVLGAAGLLQVRRALRR
jgi:hypothetical protein